MSVATNFRSVVSSDDTEETPVTPTAKTTAASWTVPPKDNRWGPLVLPPSDTVLMSYSELLVQAWPWPGQYTTLMAIGRWRTQRTIMPSDVWEVACRWEGIDSETADRTNTPIDQYERAVRAQRYAWGQLELLAEGKMPEAPASPFDLEFDGATRTWGEEQEYATKDWAQSTFARLHEQDGWLRVSAVFGELPEDLKRVLGPEFAEEFLRTPYLFGYMLHAVAGRFWPGYGGHVAMLMQLVERWNAVTQTHPHYPHRGFWQCTLHGFLYAAAHPERDHTELKQQLGQRHADSLAATVASLDTWAASSRSSWWLSCKGPGAGLNDSIAYTDPRGLLDILFG